MRIPGSWIVLLMALAYAPLALAQAVQPQRYNVVELSASVQREVANDLMTAQLFVEMSDANPATLANQLNRVLADGVRIAKDFPAIKVSTGNNQTYPVYGRNNQAQGWRGRAELRLETRDFAAGAALAGKLQTTLQLSGIQFAISSEARRKVENELIAEAIAAFRSRAEIAKTALAGKGYRVQHIAVNTGQHFVPMQEMRFKTAIADTAVAAPPIAAGESIITVSASGAVEIE